MKIKEFIKQYMIFRKEVEINVYEGESFLVKENDLLGKFRIKNSPKKKQEKLNLT